LFDSGVLIEACQEALKEKAPSLAAKEVLERLMGGQLGSEPFGPVEAGGLTAIHRSDDLTILHVVWAPNMSLYPHDHRMWAVIGVYGGQEDNTFYKRRSAGVGLEMVNGKSLGEKDVVVLGDQVIHSVTNPRRAYTAAIHVYGGDFFATSRSEWASPEAPEQPYSVEGAMKAFADANERAKELLREDA